MGQTKTENRKMVEDAVVVQEVTPALEEIDSNIFDVTLADLEGMADHLYLPLGYTEKHSVIWAQKTKQILSLDASQLGNKVRLFQIFGKSEIMAIYSKTVGSKDDLKTVPDFDEFVSDLADACRNAGLFSSHQVVSAGVWRAADDANVLVVNSLELKRSDGKPIERVSKDRNEIYTLAGDFGDPLSAEPADNKSIKEIIKALKTWGWRNKSDYLLMLGWLAISSYTGALTWRPHVYLTAEPGYGKSGLQEMIFNLKPTDSSEGDGPLDGNTSEAGLRQKIRSKALSIIIDEREAKDEKKDSGFDQLLTSASSGTTIAKGTSDQSGREDSLYFSAFLAGVNPPSRSAPLASRCVVLTLDKQPTGALPELADDSAKARKLRMPIFSRMIKNWKSFRENLATVRELLAANGLSSRIQDTYGTLIAGAITMRFAKTLSKRNMARLVKGFDLSEHIEASSRSVKADCMSHLLEQVIRDDVECDGELCAIKGSIAELAIEALTSENKTIRKIYSSSLERHGMKVKLDENKQVWLFVASSHKQLEKLFDNTGWSKTYGQQLQRISGVQHEEQIIRLCGQSKRGRYIPTGLSTEKLTAAPPPDTPPIITKSNQEEQHPFDDDEELEEQKAWEAIDWKEF